MTVEKKNIAKKVIKKNKTQSSIAKTWKTKPESDYKDWKQYSEYYSQRFISLPCLERLGERILQIIEENKEVKTFNGVLALCGTDAWSMSKFAERSEKLKAAKKRALFLLGIRREEMALDKKIDVGVFRQMQGRYDEDWKKQDIFFNELKQKVASKSGEGDKENMLRAIREIMKTV